MEEGRGQGPALGAGEAHLARSRDDGLAAWVSAGVRKAGRRWGGRQVPPAVRAQGTLALLGLDGARGGQKE